MEAAIKTVGSEDNEAVKNMRQQLDNNEDGKVSFQEYMNLIGYLAQAVSEQRSLEKETQPESSTQETQAEAAANAQAEPAANAQAEPLKAEPQAAKEVEKEDEPVIEEAAAEEQKPEEEKKTDVEQEGAKVEENKAEEKNKTEEAS
ncbi:nucleolar protein 9-like [Sinocyclocheilus anshuiensis]|uniref:nucleolar protein 9-like n=1 Tax=Sinocyclocheilus anshuiensis TaxID=1608454 RepID=UPI0007B9E08F|nr:PREDICTED: nucleolar protein 9-like [Sinocyclocheilus anshuiensis]